MTQRQEIIERLNGLELKWGSHEMLSAICKAVLPHGGAWTLRMCEDLRDRLVRLLGESMTDTEKAALERRIDELCAEVERLHADQAHWELGNCPSCPNVVSLQEALEQNAKLRELVDELYPLADYGAMDASELDRAHDLMRELGVDA